jgi:hypothetical protein
MDLAVAPHLNPEKIPALSLKGTEAFMDAVEDIAFGSVSV